MATKVHDGHRGHHHGPPGAQRHDHNPGQDELTLTPAEQQQYLTISAVLFVLGWAFELALGSPELADICFYGALGVAAWTFFPDIVAQPLGVATLMAVGGAGAAALGAVHEGATLALLFAVSELVVHRTFERTQSDLRGLLELVPHQATVLRDGKEIVVDPARLVVGDQLVVRPGERLATDGTVVSGCSAVDLSTVTGEPLPVEVHAGSPVYAAGVNGSGALVVEVTAAAADSSLTRLVALLEEAQSNRGSSEQMVDRLAARLIIGAIVLAGATFAFGVVTGDVSEWLYRSLMVLVAMSPCALAIAIPVTVLSSIGAAGRAGVLLKGGAALEALANVKVAALDKTGTLTARQPRVLEVVPAPGCDAGDTLLVAGALEARSEHPLAPAVLAAAPPAEPAENVEAVPGRGLVGDVAGIPARLGNPAFVDPGPLATDVDRLQAAGCTVVVVERAGSLLGLVAVRDELRPEAAEAVEALRAAGLGHVVMLTGDNRRAAATLGEASGVDEVRAELLPDQKVAAVRELRGRGRVLMLGDGINDAPALAAADVGVAMGAMGTDLAVEAADAALLGTDLRQLGALVSFARRSQAIVRQQLLIAAAVVAVLVPLSITGTVRLAVAVLVHELTGTLVVLSGLRAARGALLRPGAVEVTAGAGPARHRLGFTPGRAAVALVAVALVVSVAGLLHMRTSAPSPFIGWVKEARPVLNEVSELESNSIELNEAAGGDIEFSIDCTDARPLVDPIERRMPRAPDAELRALVERLFTTTKARYDTCIAGDMATSQALAEEANAVSEAIRAYTLKKTGDGHGH